MRPVDTVDTRSCGAVSRERACGRRPRGTAGRGDTAAMSIEMPAHEVYGLANALRASAGTAQEVVVHLPEPGDVGHGLTSAVEAFLDSHRTAGRALEGELQWLGDTVAAVADSWLTFDGTVLAGPGRARLG